MKNCFHGDCSKSNQPSKPEILYIFHFIRVGIHALAILDTPLLISYTMIAHSV